MIRCDIQSRGVVRGLWWLIGTLALRWLRQMMLIWTRLLIAGSEPKARRYNLGLIWYQVVTGREERGVCSEP